MKLVDIVETGLESIALPKLLSLPGNRAMVLPEGEIFSIVVFSTLISRIRKNKN